jgi:hypothetical protein
MSAPVTATTGTDIRIMGTATAIVLMATMAIPTVLTLTMDTVLTDITEDTTVIDPTGVVTGDATGGAGINHSAPRTLVWGS